MMNIPGKGLIKDPMLELYYDIEIAADPEDIWPWIRIRNLLFYPTICIAKEIE
jgi:hypothetical protein